MKTMIKCQKCGAKIEISEALKNQIQEETRGEIEKSLREKIQEEAKTEIDDLKNTLKAKDQKLEEMRGYELKLREEKRDIEEQKKDFDLQVARRLDEERKKVEEDTFKKATEQHHLKDLEKDKTIADLMQALKDAQRKGQQGSQQTQGEVAELDLEETLKNLFPTDEIVEVKKGELGGDVRQIVKTQRGTECGLILWERKRTKDWREEWVSKLKEDMQRDKARIGAIITEILPKDFKKQIGEKSGVWITTSLFIEPLAMLLRKVLYDVAKEKAVKINKQSKADEIYDFITSNEFVQQVERMLTIYQEMQSEISKERAVAERQWKFREMQVNRLITGVSGIYGSIQEIAGPALPQVKSLELLGTGKEE